MIPHYSYPLGHIQILGFFGHAAVRVHVSLNYSANVFLVDEFNYSYYKEGQRYSYYGGHATTSPVILNVPKTGDWYLVVDNGGADMGNINCNVSVETIG